MTPLLRATENTTRAPANNIQKVLSHPAQSKTSYKVEDFAPDRS